MSPTISVIIPTFNRQPILGRALQALADQSLAAGDYEVIVADDGSVDGTADLVSGLAGQYPARLIYSRDENQGANAARNRAIGQASGELLLFINDDTIAVPRFLELHVAAHREAPDEAVAILGRMTIAPELPWSVFSDLHLDAWYEALGGRTELDWRAFATCNVSVKAGFLRSYGLFDPDLRWHEDIELGLRLAAHGLRVRYVPEALGYHLHWLQEKDYLGVAAREGIALADWYLKTPEKSQELASIGLHLLAPPSKRIVYRAADCVIGGLAAPLLVQIARVLARRHPRGAQAIYRKMFQARKRRATRDRLLQIRGHATI